MKKHFVRIFVAFPLPLKIQESYLTFIKDYMKISGVRWTRKENLHMTLFFIGEIEEDQLTEVKEKLQPILLGWKAFDIKFEKVSFRGKILSPEMIWAQFEKSEEFSRNAEKIRAAVSEYMTIVPRHPEPIPHITLARLKKGADLSSINTVEFNPGDTLLIDRAELWRTVHHEEGVLYERL